MAARGPAKLVRQLVICVALAAVAAGCRTGEERAAERTVFYPLPPDPPRLQYLTALNFSTDITPEPSALERLVLGEREKLGSESFLIRPYGVAAWQGKIYVCDYAGAAVKVFDVLHRRYYRLEADKQIFAGPTNLSIDSEGYKYIVESMPRRLHIFDPQDKYLVTYVIKDGRPGGVVALGAELYVTDVTHDRILVLDRSSGKLLRTFGGKGKKPGQFLLPNAIDADAEGYLYVCDQFNNRFQKVDRNGKPIMAAGKHGDSVGAFARPRGIAVGPDGVVYVVESVYEVVQMFNQKGQVLMAFGNYHGAPGFLELPAGIAVDKSCMSYFSKFVSPKFQMEYLVFVVSQVGHAKVGVYAFGQLKPGEKIDLLVPKTPAKRAPTSPAPSAGQ